MSADALKPVLEAQGFRQHFDHTKHMVMMRPYKGCSPPYGNRQVWVKIHRETGEIRVSHSVWVAGVHDFDRWSQITWNTFCQTGVEMLAAISNEIIRTDHVTPIPNAPGSVALARTKAATK